MDDHGVEFPEPGMDYDWVERVIQQRQENQRAAFKRLLKDFPKTKEEMAQRGWDQYMENNKMSDTEELSLLVQAATQKMKDDHEIMMKRARRQILWMVFLVACAIAYEVWAIPWLEVHWLGINR
jgi:hypothetical protein